jgi:hypothetical protein
MSGPQKIRDCDRRSAILRYTTRGDGLVVDERARLLRQVVAGDSGARTLERSRSEAQRARFGSTLGPHTPVEQHIAGSHTSIAASGTLLGLHHGIGI